MRAKCHGAQVVVGGRSSPWGEGSVDNSDDVAFLCKSHKAVTVQIPLAVASMAAREIRCHLVLVDSVNGDLVSSDILSFPSA